MSKNNADILGLMANIDNGNHEFEDRIEKSAQRVYDSAKDSVAMKDAYGNSLLAVGNNDKSALFSNYWFTNDTLNWPLWLALYNDSWVFRRAIDKPARDEIRAGITLQGDENKDKIYKELNKYRFDLIQLLQWGALFGGSIAVMLFDNIVDEEYKSPMKIDKIRQSKIMRMYVVDRWYGVAPDYNKTVTNMADIDFGKPAYYNVTLADGKTVLFHHDYVIRYEHRTAPQFVKRGMLQGWGYAEGTHILNELSRDDKLKGSIQSLIDKSLIEVIKMPGMRGVFMGTDDENEMQLRKRLEMVNWGRSFNSLTFLDKDDEYNMNTFSGLGGLADILQQNMWMIAAALEMQGVLFGDLKGGLSTDTDALERYDETIQSRCESYVRPVYEKLLRVLYKKHDVQESVDFTFNSLLKDKQDKDRMQGLKDFVDTCGTLLNDGVIDTKKFATILQTYTQKGVIDIHFDNKELQELDDNMREELENVDLT